LFAAKNNIKENNVKGAFLIIVFIGTFNNHSTCATRSYDKQAGRLASKQNSTKFRIFYNCMPDNFTAFDKGTMLL